MASKKFYGYYIKGKKLALIEKDVSTSGSDLNAEDYGKYKSPKTSVTDGLELEYTYAPTFRLNSDSTIQVNKFYVNGWTVVDGYLTFLRGHNNGVAPWDNAPYNAAGDNEHINVVGSSRWNGLHKVKSGDNNGMLQTWTRVDQEVAKVSGGSSTELQFSTAGKINGDDDEGHFLNGVFSTGEYIWIKNAGGSYNGLWLVDSVDSDSSAESSSAIYVKNNYRLSYSHNTLSSEVEDVTTSWTASADDANAIIYKAYRDFCYIQADITPMQDESFVLDLPSYLNKAIVYYLKSKEFEFKNDVKGSEYFMSEFKKQMEKFNSRRIIGPSFVQGFWGMR
jgi:hypothetical protein